MRTGKTIHRVHLGVNMNIPHPNAMIIKAWADGQIVQWLVESKEPWWVDFQDNMHKCKPWIIDGTQWRIKP